MKTDLALRRLPALKGDGNASTKESVAALKSEIINARDRCSAKNHDLAEALAAQLKTEEQRANSQCDFENARDLEEGFDRLVSQTSNTFEAWENAA